MNIGIFTDTYYPQINGVATSVRMLERELNRLGHKVYIFTTSDPHVHQSLPRVFRMPSMPFIFLPTHRVALLYPPKLLLRVKRLKLDIVHTQTEFPVGIFGNLVAEFCNIPNVHTYHTMYEDYTHYIMNGHLISRSAARHYSRLFCNRARAVIAPVEKAKTSLLEYGVRRPVHVIPTGLDLSKFTPGDRSADELAAEALALKAELGIDPDDPLVLFVGRIAKEKSVDVIVRAMPELRKRLPRVKLLIVGGGPVAGELERLAAELGVADAILFSGPKPWDEIGGYYRLGDVFVTASTSETQGLTYIEAMAAGRPVVAKNDPSVAGVLNPGENGYLFDQDAELPGLLYSILTNREEAQRVADRGRESVAHLSATAFATDVSRLYEEVLRDFVPRRLPQLAVWRKLRSGVKLTPLRRAAKNNEEKP